MFFFADIIYARGISSRGERQPATLDLRVREPRAVPEGCGPATTESSNLSERGSTPRQPATLLRGHRIDGSTLPLQGRGPGSIPGGSTTCSLRVACVFPRRLHSENAGESTGVLPGGTGA